MKTILYAILVVLFAAPALAADTNVYPDVLMDSTCTDLFDAPENYTPGLTRLGGGGPQVGSESLIQLTGDPDGFCDNDSRIIAGDIVADTVFGPIEIPQGTRCLIIHVDVGAIAGGSSDWSLEPGYLAPVTGVFRRTDVFATQSSTGIDIFVIGAGTPIDNGTVLTEVQFGALPNPVSFNLNLVSATSMTASVGLVRACP